MSGETRLIPTHQVWQSVCDLLHVDSKGLRKMVVTFEVGNTIDIQTYGYACKRIDTPPQTAPDAPQSKE